MDWTKVISVEFVGQHEAVRRELQAWLQDLPLMRYANGQPVLLHLTSTVDHEGLVRLVIFAEVKA